MYSQNLITTPLATESNLERLGTDNLALLRSHGLTEYNTAEEIAFAMGISLKKLHFLTTSIPTSLSRHYLPFKIPKKTGGERIISAPNAEVPPFPTSGFLWDSGLAKRTAYLSAVLFF